jgi:hypothetical protein
MKGKRRRRHAHYAGPPGLPTAELAAQLAPAEERDRKAAEPQATGAAANGGAIIIDKGGPALPDGLGAARKSTKLFNDRVVIIIIALALLFIAFVAWQVSRMTDEPTPVRVIQE